MNNRKLKIALLGTRGIPARYGGFETFAEELSTRLAALGHQVTVYARHRLGSGRPVDIEYRGVAVRSTATIMHKYCETPLHGLSSFLDLLRRDCDIALVCNAANAPFAWLLRLRGLPLVINVDGIERKRGKWNALGRLWYALGERCAVWFASRVVADAKVIADYYLDEYGCESAVIGYGAEAQAVPAGDTLAQFSLSSGQYILYVSRLEPENNAKGVIEAYVQSGVEIPLVVVGDAPYADTYKAELRRVANERVIFTGFQFGRAYQELRSHCRLYVQATEVGGTHPALVEAMAYGNCIIANQTPEHQEVLGDAGLYYPFNDFGRLATLMQSLVVDDGAVAKHAELARARARALYSWESVVTRYEQLFLNLTEPRAQRAPGANKL